MAIPVSLEAAKHQLRIELDDTSQDDQVRDWIADAAAWVERYTGHILEARDVEEAFTGFGALKLRAWPLKSDAVPVVTYENASGQPVAVTDVRISISRRPGRVVLRPGARWPIHCGHPTVTVTVRAGYEPEDVVPGNFRRAMLILIAAYDGDREGGDVLAKAEKAAKSLCRPFRVTAL
jgi:uncharacterized phiE125 gp8 family phage protein